MADEIFECTPEQEVEYVRYDPFGCALCEHPSHDGWCKGAIYPYGGYILCECGAEDE